MSDPNKRRDVDKLVDDLRSKLSVPDSGTVRVDIRVRIPPFDNTPLVCVESGAPIALTREIIDEAKERVDLRRRGKVGEAIVDLDTETWRLEIEGDDDE